MGPVIRGRSAVARVATDQDDKWPILRAYAFIVVSSAVLWSVFAGAIYTIS